jgi:AAA15 family ATPase/GTPase
MYKSFEIKNLRCFSYLNVSNLERVNLIVGKNNVGKTALLEALFIHCGGVYHPALILNLNILRGMAFIASWMSDQTPWDSLFYNFNTLEPAELKGKIEIGKQIINRGLTLKVPHEKAELAKVSLPIDPLRLRSEPGQILELSYEENGEKRQHFLIIKPSRERKGEMELELEPAPPPPPFPAFFLAAGTRVNTPEDVDRFSKLKLNRQHEKIVSALQLIEPRLKNLEVLTISGVPIIHGDIGLERPVPLPLMGEGMTRLTSFLLSIGTTRGGVVLIDEIENGFHYSVLEKVWRVVIAAARDFDVQVFATTHSWECIKAVHEALSQDEIYDFKLYRLERIDDKVEAVEYSRETLEAALSIEIEVR